jgi:vacuolar-type H+-ATPase subunit I/STV1
MHYFQNLALLTSHACAPPRAKLLFEVLPVEDSRWWRLNVAATIMAICSIVGVFYIIFGLAFVTFREGTTGKERIMSSRIWHKLATLRMLVRVVFRNDRQIRTSIV